MKLISNHISKHSKPVNMDQFGYYLAGLIDGAGWFTESAAHIVFHHLDASLAYYIKKRIGYGSVKKVKFKNVYVLTVDKQKGLDIIVNFINGKLRTQSKCDDIVKYILNPESNLEFDINRSKNMDTHWLAGFLDTDGTFLVNCPDSTLLTSGPRTEISLSLVVEHNTRLLLDLIRDEFDGNIDYTNPRACERAQGGTGIYTYSSSSFDSARKLIGYLDKYHLLSSKYVNYFKWRKVYQLIQENKHLYPKGLARIIKIKSSIKPRI